MSNAIVSKRLSNQLLQKLSSEHNKKTRIEAQKGRPQILQLKDLNFINEALEAIVERGKGSKTIKGVTITAEDLRWAQGKADEYQEKFVKSRRFTHIEDTLEYKHISEVLPNIAADITAGQSFIIGSFRTIATIKRSIVDHVLKAKSKNLRERVKAKIDRGHGVAGGVAISSLQLSQAASLASANDIDLVATPGLSKYLETQFKESGISLKNIEIIKSVLVDYQSLVDKSGNLSASYVPIVTFQDFYSNRGIDAREEKKVLEIVRNFFTQSIGANELVNMKGSPTINDKIKVHVATPFIDLAKRNKNVKLKTTVKKIKDTGKKEAPSKQLSPGALAVTQKRTGAKKTFKRKKVDNTQRSMFSIIALINQRLPQTVQKNMTEPALVNRTGRFANSVRVTDVIQTRQGFPSMGYTYQRDPYEVFEMSNGNPSWSTPDRDPRKIIDQSIREIAAELAIGRFYTRRV